MTLLDRQKRTHKHGQRAEKKTSIRLGVRKNPGSGAIEGLKGDLTSRDYLMENKATEHRSISIKLDWLEKISREARQVNRQPALTIQFVDKLGNPVPYGRWVMIPEDEYREILEESQ